MKKITSTDTVSVHYTGRLEDGTIFDTSIQEGREPLKATLGQGQLIKGFESGLVDMTVGEKKTIEMENFFNPEAMSTGSAIATMVVTVLGLLGFAGSHYIKDMISKLRRKGEDDKADEVEQALQDAMGGETEEMGEQTLSPQDDF